jgi:hypothetical protein
LDSEDFQKAFELKGQFYLTRDTSTRKLKNLPKYLSELEVRTSEDHGERGNVLQEDRYIEHWYRGDEEEIVYNPQTG